MDRVFQDMSIVDKHFRELKLVIPRGSMITTIMFLKDKIYIYYIFNNQLQIAILEYDELNFKKIVID